MEPSAPFQLPFEAIFPDTNLFLPRWPEEPAALAELVSLARQFAIKVYLLEAVEMELEGHQLRAAKETIERIAKEARSLPTSLRFNGPETPIDWVAFRDEFRSKASLTKEKLGLLNSSFPPLQLQDLFEMATNQERPFVDEGKNFQDAVIFRSVIEASRHANLKEVAFVTRNRKDFEAAVVSTRVKESGITIHLFENLDALQNVLFSHVKAVLIEKWANQDRLALEAVNLVWDDLESFLRTTLMQDSLDHLELLRIENVHTEWFDALAREEPRTALRITAEARFTMKVPASDWTNTPRRPYEIDRGVTVEGWGNYVNDHYEQVEFESAFISR